MKSQLFHLYRTAFGAEPTSVVDLRGDGSDRRIYRITGPDDHTVIGVHGPDDEENRAFLAFSRSFRGAGLPVPEIYASDEDAGIYLEEDLGDITLYARLGAARTGREFPEEMITIYRRVAELLPRVQIEGGRVVDYSVAYPYREFDRRSMMWDLNYFKYHYLKLARIPFNESRLEQDFESFCDMLLRADRTHFLFRDFQSRNIMLRDDAPWLIDYQGGRRGALQYDIASLLYDAKADIPEPLRERLLDHYLDALEGYLSVDRDEFRELYRGYVLIRIMQAMGAYGYRGFFERKPHFLASVPYAVGNIALLLEQGAAAALPELRDVLRRVTESNQGTSAGGSAPRKNGNGRTTDEPAARISTGEAPLTVHVRSFSYKQGYPQDETGHGGGFVFDCRSLHNPGRYDHYKSLCGLDADVIDFLEGEPEVETFWSGVTTLVEGAVAAYLSRGFNDLSIAFGCTGGRHRSVYFAERLTRHLRERFPEARVVTLHREQESWQVAAVTN